MQMRAMDPASAVDTASQFSKVPLETRFRV